LAFSHTLIRSVKDYCTSGKNAALSKAYNQCVQEFAGLRIFHLGVSTEYLIRTKIGTGASTFRDMLKEAYDATKLAKV
jgi:hypothetical protein